jgi:internalin A
MRRLLSGILLTASLGGSVPAAADQEQRPEPLPAEVVEAWQKAGAWIGWVGVDREGYRILHKTADQGKSGDIPEFTFASRPAGDLAKLPQPPRAFGLELMGEWVTNAGLKELAGMKNLQSLGLSSFTRVTDVGLKELAGLTGLQTLNLADTKMTDAGLKELAGLTGLKSLTLYKTKVRDAGLKELAGMTSLQSLILSSTRVTGAGVRELQKALPALSIENNADPMVGVVPGGPREDFSRSPAFTWWELLMPLFIFVVLAGPAVILWWVVNYRTRKHGGGR